MKELKILLQNMKKLTGLADKVSSFLKGQRWILWLFLSLLIILIFVITRSDTYCGKLFFTDGKRQILFYENRQILRGKDRLDKLNKIVEEVLLGPVSQDYINLFSNNAMVISSWLEGGDYHLNLSKDTILDINLDKRGKDETNPYDLLLGSILFSINFNVKGVHNVIFYFDGKKYQFIDKFKLNEKKIKFSWQIFKK